MECAIVDRLLTGHYAKHAKYCDTSPEIRIDSWISNYSKTFIHSKFFVVQIDYSLVFPVHWYVLLIVDRLGESDWDSIQLHFCSVISDCIRVLGIA